MVNRYNISLKYMVKSYKVTLGSERRLQSCSDGYLSIGAASTGTTRGEAGLAPFFFIMLILLIPAFKSI
jgi:hypothetical protein